MTDVETNLLVSSSVAILKQQIKKERKEAKDSRKEKNAKAKKKRERERERDKGLETETGRD